LFNKHNVGDKNFEIGYLVLKWDKVNEPKWKHAKFQHLCLGPFQVVEKIRASTYRLKILEGDLDLPPVISQILKSIHLIV
jgi:hypothetical protein